MDKQELRQIIQEEITKANKQPIIKDVHLHIHGDALNGFDIFDKMEWMQNSILTTRVLEKLNQEVSK